MVDISVIIPVYNVEKYLKRCLDSVFNQTIPFKKVIIVNDGSTDASGDICKLYADINDNVVLINKKNGGLVSAWKEGLKYLETDYVCFVDSDDFIAEDYLEVFLRDFQNDLDMVCMNCTRINDAGDTTEFNINNLKEGVYLINDNIKSKLLSDEGCFIRPVASSRWAKIIRSSIVQEYAQYCSEDISYGEDQQLTIGILIGCKKIKVISEYKYYYQNNASSILHTYKSNLWDKIMLLMDVIRNIPGIQILPDFEVQYNTQVLLYFCECLRNEAYNDSLSRTVYINMVSSKKMQDALRLYASTKMRKIDRLLVKLADEKRYVLTLILLKLYILLYKVRKVEG